MLPALATLSKLLQIEGNLEHFHVPKYQRAYSWNKKNWDVLLDDILENKSGYFMGTIICVDDRTERRPNEEKVYELIDGQQRLTTISLLIAAILKKYLALTPNKEDRDEFLISSLAKKLVKKKNEFYKYEDGGFMEGKNMCFLRVQPSTQDKNLDDYKYALGDIGLLNNISKPKYYGLRTISNAFEFFYEKLPTNLLELLQIKDKIDKLEFIHITVGSQADAFVLFETLNNRGVPLSAVDIIKNKVMTTMEKKHGIDMEESYNEWQKLLTNIPDYRDQDRFLRQYYNTFKVDDSIKIEGVPKATKSTLIEIYEQLIKKDAKKVFNDLLSKSEIYSMFIDPADIEDKYNFKRALIELSRVQAAPAYSLLLFIFSMDSKSFKTEATRVEIVEFLIKYFVRRNVTDFPNTRDLDAIMIDAIEKLNEKIIKKEQIEAKDVFNIILTGIGKPSSINEFVAKLGDNLFKYNEDMARYVLITLDSISHTREYKPDFWERNDKDKYVWTIEHVFPQKEDITDDWVKMVANGDKNKASEVQERCVHCLGNLTLSGYNSKLSFKPFKEKQIKMEATSLGQKIFIGYKNGLAINKFEFTIAGKTTNLADCELWNEETIMARNEAIVKEICKLMAFEFEKETK